MAEPVYMTDGVNNVVATSAGQVATMKADGWIQGAAPEIVVEPVAIYEEFPFADILKASGIENLQDIPTDEEGLMQFSGIGQTKAAAILDALSKLA